MGLMSALRPGIGPAHLAAAAALTVGASTASAIGPAPLSVASPWAPRNNLASVVWADIFGSKLVPLTRAEAMAVPAAARARHIICGTIAQRPFRAWRGETRLTRATGAPTWVDATNGALSPFHRMLWTVDDLLWSGWSCWSRRNSTTAGESGRPIQLDRLPMERWAFGTDDEGRTVVTVDNLPVRDNEVVLIPGPHEGLLTFAQSAIRHASDLQRAAGRAARHPAAYLAIQQTGGPPLQRSSTDPNVVTIESTIDGWARAREGENGGVAWLSEGLKVQELGTFDRHLVLDGRNAAALDIARSASLPGDLVDAAGPSSLTYQNSRDNDRRAVDYGVGIYMAAIAARLSQDDVMPAGVRVEFDLQEWLTGTVPGSNDAVAPTAPTAVPVQPARPLGVAS